MITQQDRIDAYGKLKSGKAHYEIISVSKDKKRAEIVVIYGKKKKSVTFHVLNNSIVLPDGIEELPFKLNKVIAN